MTALLALAACGGSTTSPSTSSASVTGAGTINIGVIGPMTGPAAEIGNLMSGACYAAVLDVNKAGGVLGRKVGCTLVDDTGDPADAVPNVTRALATIENLLVAAPGQRGESAAGVAAGRWLWRRDEDELAEAARGLLRLFGMAEAADERAGRLSGGQKRMLEVMRALMAGPRLLLLDEPMAGLAPALAERLEAACRQLAGAGMSILLVEHELGVVERLCETVVVMHQRKVISEGRMAELRTRKEVQDAYVVG